MAALGVVVLLLGSIGDVLDLCAVLIASTLIFVVCEELGNGAGLITYVACAVISIVILSLQRPVTLEFVIFGFYPALRRILERLPKVFCVVIKVMYMLVSGGAMVLITKFLIGGIEEKLIWQIAAGVLGIVCMVLCDVFFKRFGRYYHLKLRKMLRIDRFFS